MKFFDLDHPFFRPLWVRLLVTGLTLGWGVFEFVTGSPFWAMVFLGAGAWCAYSFFFAPKRDESEGEQDD